MRYKRQVRIAPLMVLLGLVACEKEPPAAACGDLADHLLPLLRPEIEDDLDGKTWESFEIQYRRRLAKRCGSLRESDKSCALEAVVFQDLSECPWPIVSP